MSAEELCPARYVGLVSGGRECRLPVGHRLGPHITSDGHTWTDEDMARWRRAGLLPANGADRRSVSHRKIVETAGPGRRTRQGIIKTCVLECGHISDCNATERRRGWLPCFDCFYGRPAPSIE